MEIISFQALPKFERTEIALSEARNGYGTDFPIKS
jgi:hypothetical protein